MIELEEWDRNICRHDVGSQWACRKIGFSVHDKHRLMIMEHFLAYI